jgi:hypothetical protein
MRRVLKRVSQNYESTRFSLALDFRYSIVAPEPRAGGAGRTVWIGSHELAFVTDGSIRQGEKIQMSMTWPAALDNGVALQLTVVAIVALSLGTTAIAKLTRYEFRTRAAAKAGVPALWETAAPCLARC